MFTAGKKFSGGPKNGLGRDTWGRELSLDLKFDLTWIEIDSAGKLGQSRVGCQGTQELDWYQRLGCEFRIVLR